MYVCGGGGGVGGKRGMCVCVGGGEGGAGELKLALWKPN